MSQVLRVIFIISFSHFVVFTFGQNVGIDILSPEGKFHVKGSDDTTQFIIDANDVQSILHPLFKLRNSDGADLLWMTADDSSNVFLGMKAGASNSLNFQGRNNTSWEAKQVRQIPMAETILQ